MKSLLKERYIVNKGGKRLGVFLNMKDYQKLLDAIEELESIRAYERAKSSKDEIIPFETAVEEIRQSKR